MEYFLSFIFAASLLWGCLHAIISRSSTRTSGGIRLPPGPPPLPIVGNLFQLGRNPHRSLTRLSRIYGPVMSLKLGSITTVVISSPDAARQVLHLHDKALSTRSIPDSVRAIDHHLISVVWLPVDAPWRRIRKLCNMHLFSPTQLDAGEALRREKLDELLVFVRDCSVAAQAVDIGLAVFTTVINLLSNMIFSVDLVGDEIHGPSSRDFKALIGGVTDKAGLLNLGDYFPAVRWMDLQGARRDTSVYFQGILEVFDGIIGRRLETSAGSPARNDVLGTLLGNISGDDEDRLSLDDVKHLLLDLFIAGVDTTTNTVEWAMAELIRQPEIMSRARKELNESLGDDAPLRDADIRSLPYLQAVVKETLRCHPPAPFLLPHRAESSVQVEGFTVPKGAQVLVNAWAVGRDPEVWANPERFEPERCLGRAEMEVKERSLGMVPFGAGRRICPGQPMALRMLPMMLATLIRRFEWKVEGGMEMEMGEQYGLTVKMDRSLRAVPVEVQRGGVGRR